jgi:hypothetical protein
MVKAIAKTVAALLAAAAAVSLALNGADVVSSPTRTVVAAIVCVDDLGCDHNHRRSCVRRCDGYHDVVGRDRRTVMAPENIEKARRSTLIRPVVRSTAATKKLAASLRRLDADNQTIDSLTNQGSVRPTAR